MRTAVLEGFEDGDFLFLGGHVFSSANGFSLLLGDAGTMIILQDGLLMALAARKPSEGLRFKLVQHGLATVEGRGRPPESRPIPRYFVLDLTSACNLDCIYCFRRSGPARSMSLATLRDALDFIIDYCREEQIDRIGVQPWGGEPTLETEKIAAIGRAFQRTGIRVNLDLETNATLVDANLADRLHSLGVHVGVSIDGDSVSHDHHRRLKDGGGSFDIVATGIAHLQRRYLYDLGTINVITRHNCHRIGEILKCYVFELGVRQVKFNIVRDNPFARESNLLPSIQEIRDFENALLNEVVAYNRMGIRFKEGNISVRLENLLFRSGKDCCLSHGCTGGRAIVSIAWNGDIYPCEMFDFPEEKIGSIYGPGGLAEQIEMATLLRNRFEPTLLEKCRVCAWRYYCGGGCTSRIRYGGSVAGVDEVMCAVNNVLYPRLVELVLEEPNLAYSLI
jgi:uncharacterized protein